MHGHCGQHYPEGGLRLWRQPQDQGGELGKEKMGRAELQTEATFPPLRISAGPAVSAGGALHVLLNFLIPRTSKGR